MVNGTEIPKSTAKDSEIVPNNLWFVNISGNFSASNMRKTGFNVHVYEFSVDYVTIDVDNILDIHKYLIKKNHIV